MQSKKFAEQLYEKELIRMKILLGNTTTYSDQIKRVGRKLFGKRFLGVFASDQIPKRLPRGSLIIVNLDSSDEIGSHWVGVAKCQQSDVLLVYDSFGRSVHEILPMIKGRGRKVVDTEDDAEQLKEETNCGARSMAFLSVFDKYGFGIAKHI